MWNKGINIYRKIIKSAGASGCCCVAVCYVRAKRKLSFDDGMSGKKTTSKRCCQAMMMGVEAYEEGEKGSKK